MSLHHQNASPNKQFCQSHNRQRVCAAAPVPGCRAIQVIAAWPGYGWRLIRQAGRALTGTIDVGTTTGPDEDAWVKFNLNAFISYLGNGLVSYIPSRGDTPAPSGGDACQPFGTSYHFHWDWDCRMDVGDGVQNYSSSHDWNFAIDPDSGIVTSFSYSNSCGGSYNFTLSLSTGEISETGSLATVVAEARAGTGEPFWFWIGDCPAGATALAYWPVTVGAGTGGYINSVNNGWAVDKIEYSSSTDGGSGTLTFSDFTTESTWNQHSSVTWTTGGTTPVSYAPSAALTMAQFVRLDDLTHQYTGDGSGADGIFHETDASYLGSRISWNSIYQVYWTTQLTDRETDGLYFGTLNLFPKRLVILYAGNLVGRNWVVASKKWANCCSSGFAARALVGITGDNYQQSYEHQEPIENRAAEGDTDPEARCAGATGIEDCLNNFLPVGNNILEPSAMLFPYGEIYVTRRNFWAADELTAVENCYNTPDPDPEHGVAGWTTPC